MRIFQNFNEIDHHDQINESMTILTVGRKTLVISCRACFMHWTEWSAAQRREVILLKCRAGCVLCGECYQGFRRTYGDEEFRTRRCTCGWQRTTLRNFTRRLTQDRFVQINLRNIARQLNPISPLPPTIAAANNAATENPGTSRARRTGPPDQVREESPDIVYVQSWNIDDPIIID